MVIFLCSLESFIIKSLQDRKSYKQIIHICTVCSNRQARRRRAVGEMDSVGCVSMWWYMYIEGYILFFEILRIRGLSMSRFVIHSLRNQNKNKKKLTDGVGVC